MKLRGNLYCNGDDCFLAWDMPFRDDCWGFAIYRELKPVGKKPVKGYLFNRTGFEGDKNKPFSRQPSNEWPFQRYTWTDHYVSEGDEVAYTISPVIHDGSQLVVDQKTSLKLGPCEVVGTAPGGAAAYFTRGLLLSQFVAKRLGPGWTLKDLDKLKSELKDDSNDLRQFLAGQVATTLDGLLDRAKDEDWHVYAALYELDDEHLVEKLKALGKNAHVVLANGSTKKKGEDGNAKAAKRLGNSIDLKRRMLWSEGLGHNKFAVFATSPKRPFMVWTGSTNWSTTGLCTQLNNAIVIKDAALAKEYQKQWQLLHDDTRAGRNGAAMHFGPDLMQANDGARTGNGKALGSWRTWFTRTSDGRELAEVTKLINAAKEAILFVMFEPGNKGLLQVIQARAGSDLYIHGVVNTLKGPADENQGVDVKLIKGKKKKTVRLDVVQPEGVGGGLANWAKEVSRRDFLKPKGVIGFAITHSKMIVIDPFTRPIVITGSHNFSQAASSKNDENLLIIKGNKVLAQRYAVNIMGVYQHYRWRAYLKDCAGQGKTPWQGLVKSDRWQHKGNKADPEVAFWA